MKRTIPLLITALGGFVLVGAFFIPAFESWGEEASIWFDILAAIAFILGGGNLFKVHLKTISDRKKGWGFSAVTLLSFLVMLFLGLFKIGTRPSPSTEFYGQSVVRFPLEWMPEYSTPGQLRDSAKDTAFPASIRRQLRRDGENLHFRGWVDDTQAEALDALDDQLAWRAACEKLAEVAQPPESLRGKIRYLSDHGLLAFTGVMSPQDEAALAQLFNSTPAAQAAISELAAGSRQRRSVTAQPPPGFQIPQELADVVRVQDQTLEVAGPMSPEMRGKLSRRYCHYPVAKPLSKEDQGHLRAEIESRGDPLTPEQVKALDLYIAGMWKIDLFLPVLEGIGAPKAGRKTSTQLLTEQQAGVTDLQRVLPATGTLEPMTDAQRTLLQKFEQAPEMTAADLLSGLQAEGLTAGRLAAVEEFLDQLPTVGDRNKALCLELLENGPLTRPQRDWLLEDARAEYAWRRSVANLFEASHITLYPWSGDYSEVGTPFDWCYTWVLQPLMTTTFALLAFYVASAAFRAFRAKNLEASLLLGTALIILFRATMFAGYVSVPIGGSLFGMDRLYAFVMSIFNTAGNRAIMIGIALGIASTSLKVLLGIDRSYLGSDE
jgi:hypothetical protein